MRSQYVITASYFHPLTKILSTLFLGFTPLYKLEAGYTWGMVGLLALAFYLEGEKRESLRAGVTFWVISFGGNLLLERGPSFLLPLTSFLLIVQVLYLPLLSAKWMVETTDVGSLLAALDQIRVPKEMSLPLAVVFRFFPTFKEEEKNIRRAMKVRGLTMKHPLQYMEALTVPLLVEASHLADDLAKSAETKGIANPSPKTHYVEVHWKKRDSAYLIGMVAMMLGGA